MFAATVALAATTVFATGSTAAANTELVVNIMLQGHDNDDLNLRNGEVSYYKGGWQAITGTNANNRNIAQVNLAPGTYTFAVVYNGTRNQKTVEITKNGQIVYFHAALVNVDLKDSRGNPLAVDSASYYAGGWHTIDTSTGVEMLPGTYSFAAVYNGTRQQKSYTVLANNPNIHTDDEQTVEFQTTRAMIQLQGHTNANLNIPANGAASYYAGGWHSITTLNPNDKRMVYAEMLPGTYAFALEYKGTRAQKSVAISGTTKIVYFHAALVKTSLTVGGEAIDPTSVSSSYYAGGWRTLDPAGVQMLPGTYAFAVTYNGVRSQQSYTVLEHNPNNHANANQTVAFVR